MSEKITVQCDISGCANTNHNSQMLKKISWKVIMLTSENDGTPTKPHFIDVNIDICKDCNELMLNEQRYITAAGAMGYNKYYLKK